MLEIKNISKYFNTNLVLDNVSFKVPKGKIFGIIGPNGAGKTTTLRIILGILSPSSGQISFNNESLGQNFQNITGYLPEERGLYPKSSLINTLIYLAQLKGLNYQEASAKTLSWLERVDLLDYKKFHIEELSKGNQQKVQFISAIIHQPEILILDEPFSGFDPVNQSIFREIIEEIKSDRFIILSTHLMDLAESLCDNIFLLNEGKEVLSGEINQILNTSDQNIYKIIFSDLPKIETIKEHYRILSKEDTSLLIDIADKNPSKILNKIVAHQDVNEFYKIKPTLHQLFISQIDKSDK